LPKRPEVPDIVTSGLDTVAVRLPSHPAARKIIKYSGTAVAAPSANPFGYISPTSAAHVAKMLGNRVDFIVDGGPCSVGVESTVIDATGEIAVVLRPGGMPLERIREIVGEVRVPERKDNAAIVSPGQLDSHYAPRAALYLYDFGALPEALRASRGGASASRSDSVAVAFDGRRAAALEETGLFGKVYALSPRGEMREAAARLFALLHDLDAEGCGAIFAEKVPEEGLGRAINDRLYRASRKK
jgi:L-threonylcarbamoyladenylate synthase